MESRELTPFLAPLLLLREWRGSRGTQQPRGCWTHLEMASFPLSILSAHQVPGTWAGFLVLLAWTARLLATSLAWGPGGDFGPLQAVLPQLLLPALWLILIISPSLCSLGCLYS